MAALSLWLKQAAEPEPLQHSEGPECEPSPVEDSVGRLRQPWKTARYGVAPASETSGEAVDSGGEVWR